MVALALGASACAGSSDTEAAETDAGTPVATADADTATQDEGDTSSADDATAVTDEADTAEDGTPSDSSSPANFPSVDVVDLGSGSTVNFAEEVAGGSLPTLIWFWAPH